MKKLILICTCLTFTLITKAQTEDKKWNIGLHGGATQYKGDLGNDFYKTDMAFYGVGGLSVSRYLSSHFSVNFLASKGTVGYSRPNGNFSNQFTSALLNFRFNILGPKSVVRPYIFVGGGAMLFDKNLTITGSNVDFIAPSFGGGINFRLSPVVTLNFQETFMYSNEDKRDKVIASENDTYLMHTVGLTFNFGKKKDEDKDGVNDRNDKCPNTPSMVAVDKNGCPLDKDSDSVADYLDGCPDVAGTVALQGCPDKDGDGIADKDDSCPDVAGVAAFKGCPDRDNDGITDAEDRCPDIAGSKALRGCSDTDRDGIADMDDKCPDTKSGFKVDASGCPMDNDNDGILNEEDRCPNVAGTANFRGCPDTDRDGVADMDDRCPNIAGTMANRGCPEITKEEVKKITQIASKIFFETNSDKLKVASLVQLDELARIVSKYESANLLIEGHTDSQGKDDFNMTLSQKRTESVKTYLMGKGIMESRLTATGLGETKPIADNKTALGRAKNRRVELKTSYSTTQ